MDPRRDYLAFPPLADLAEPGAFFTGLAPLVGPAAPFLADPGFVMGLAAFFAEVGFNEAFDAVLPEAAEVGLAVTEGFAEDDLEEVAVFADETEAAELGLTIAF
jgi:hypothetical protein